MALSIDSSRPFLGSSELHDLAAAVRDAGGHDEGMWIEWKSALDLNSAPARIHMVKNILGFANRDPELAIRRAGGFAYLLIGVEPGNVRGVTTIDHSILEERLEAYVGTHVRWTPEYIKLDGNDVLVIVVDSPKIGDRVHYLQKDLKKDDGHLVHPVHTVFVRRNARTVRASDWDMESLWKRSVPAADRIAPPYRELDELASKVRGNDPGSQRNSLAMLERIGVDHPSFRQLVIDNVCQFLRSADDSSVESREFAQAILTRRLTGLDFKFEDVDDGSVWENIDIDLTGARLVNLDWRAGSAATAVFQNAKFLGDTLISDFEFRYTADFSSCRFGGATMITNTRFGSCDFSGSTFEGDFTFHGSEVDGMANFMEAIPERDASFRGAIFKDVAVFKGLHFKMDAIFEGVEFCGDVYFDGSHFAGVGQFECAIFHQVISFNGVTSHGEFDFARARALSSYLPARLPEGWILGPYASCVAIVGETDIPEQDRGKSRPVFGSGYCAYCAEVGVCEYRHPWTGQG